MFAVGRDACTQGIGLDTIGVKMEAGSGKVIVNEAEQTSVENVFAIGDVLQVGWRVNWAEEKKKRAGRRERGVCTREFMCLYAIMGHCPGWIDDKKNFLKVACCLPSSINTLCCCHLTFHGLSPLPPRTLCT